MLTGKKGLVIGIANDKSIAYGVAQVCRQQGAELAITYLNDKALAHVQPLATSLGIDPGLQLPFDITREGQLEAVFATLSSRWGNLDFVVHAMASATKEMTTSRLIDVKLDDFNFAMQVSCHSFLAVARAAEPLMTAGGTIITMTYVGSNRVLGNYHFMAPMKAALEASVRYVAEELGPKNIRVHAVSPGAIATRAAAGISNFDQLLATTEKRAPLRRLCTPDDVGRLTAFLVGPDAEGMTGGIHFVDGGFNITS